MKADWLKRGLGKIFRWKSNKQDESAPPAVRLEQYIKFRFKTEEGDFTEKNFRLSGNTNTFSDSELDSLWEIIEPAIADPQSNPEASLIFYNDFFVARGKILSPAFMIGFMRMEDEINGQTQHSERLLRLYNTPNQSEALMNVVESFMTDINFPKDAEEFKALFRYVLDRYVNSLDDEEKPVGAYYSVREYDSDGLVRPKTTKAHISVTKDDQKPHEKTIKLENPQTISLEEAQKLWDEIAPYMQGEDEFHVNISFENLMPHAQLLQSETAVSLSLARNIQGGKVQGSLHRLNKPFENLFSALKNSELDGPFTPESLQESIQTAFEQYKNEHLHGIVIDRFPEPEAEARIQAEIEEEAAARQGHYARPPRRYPR